MPRRPIAQRLASPAVKEQEPRPGVRQPPGRTAHRFAPRGDTVPPPADARLEDYTPLLRSLTAGPLAWPRSLIVGLILFALLPNLTVIALLWFPAARGYWSKPAPQPAVEAAAPPNLPMTENDRARSRCAAAKVGPVLMVLNGCSEGESWRPCLRFLPLELDGTAGVPQRSGRRHQRSDACTSNSEWVPQWRDGTELKPGRDRRT